MATSITPEYLLTLVAAFFASMQVRTLLGLIVLDFLLGFAASIRSGAFDWPKLAQFYGTNVVPYLIGYLAFFLVIGFIIPPEALAGLGNPFDGFGAWETVTLVAWGVLVATLAGSIARNVRTLYQPLGMLEEKK